MAKPMSKSQWVELFESIGLTDQQMWHWHAEFESRYPENHQDFLEWLALPERDIASIREKSGKLK